MGKQPSFQFYPNDWSRDLEEHPLEIEGAWIRICCKLWWAEERGKSCKPIEHWARLLSIDTNNLLRIMEYIEKFKIGDVTKNSNFVTIINRRMYKEYRDRENTRLRVKRYREKQRSNATVTPPSSSSSSSSSPFPKKEEKIKSVPNPKTATGPKPYKLRVDDFFESINDEQRTIWIEAYPNVDLDKEFRKAKAWLLSNTGQAKKDFRKFLNNWLARSMDRSKGNETLEEQMKRLRSAP